MKIGVCFIVGGGGEGGGGGGGGKNETRARSVGRPVGRFKRALTSEKIGGMQCRDPRIKIELIVFTGEVPCHLGLSSRRQSSHSDRTLDSQNRQEAKPRDD